MLSRWNISMQIAQPIYLSAPLQFQDVDGSSDIVVTKAMVTATAVGLAVALFIAVTVCFQYMKVCRGSDVMRCCL